MNEKKVVSSEIEVTLKVIGGKWKPLILQFLQHKGTKRYNEIMRYLGTAPKKTVTAQLRELEEDGIIERTVISTGQVQVEYSITEHGTSLFPILNVMCEWGYANMGNRFELTHAVCGTDKKDKDKNKKDKK
jgi:DNA-binding HxlR family transcriptional regulator